MGISFLLLCPTCSKSPIARAGRIDIVKLFPLQSNLDPLTRKYQICEARGNVTHQLFIVKHWQRVHYHSYHFSFHHGGCHLCCQVPPLLGILLKGLMLPFAHILHLGSVRSHVNIVLILPDEGRIKSFHERIWEASKFVYQVTAAPAKLS